MGKCDGAVVIAFERTRIIRALEKPDSPGEQVIRNESHPTIWNQMEAAMAYGQRVPILTFVQSGLRRQAMLSDRLEWMAIDADLSPHLLRTAQFKQVFEEWLGRVTARREEVSTEEDIDLGELGIGRLLTKLKTKQVWSVLIALGGLIVGISAVAFRVGQLYRPN